MKPWSKFLSLPLIIDGNSMRIKQFWEHRIRGAQGRTIAWIGRGFALMFADPRFSAGEHRDPDQQQRQQPSFSASLQQASFRWTWATVLTFKASSIRSPDDAAAARDLTNNSSRCRIGLYTEWRSHDRDPQLAYHRRLVR